MTITDDDIQARLVEYELALIKEVDAAPPVRLAWKKMVAMFTELLELRKPKPAPEIPMQMLINAGINGFALELLSESLAGKKDIKTFNALRFSYRGVIYTLEPAKPKEETT